MKNPLVIGYRGEIGSYLLAGLLKYIPKALDILLYDVRENEEERLERITKADVIFLCVPLDKTLEFFQEYKEELRGKIVVEQSSLKSVLYTNSGFNAKTHGIHVLSMHVLFRPSTTPDKKDHWVALMDKRRWDTIGAEVKLFLICGLDVHLVEYKNWKAHDQDMAISQALLHRIILVLGDSLMQSRGSTYLVKRVCELCNRIKDGDLTLYQMIQDNPGLEAELQSFQKRLANFKLSNYISQREVYNT